MSETPKFVRRLEPVPGADADAEPLALAPEVAAELDRTLREMRDVRDAGAASGASYFVHGGLLSTEAAELLDGIDCDDPVALRRIHDLMDADPLPAPAPARPGVRPAGESDG